MREALHISDSNLEVLFPKIEDLLLLSERFLMSLLNLRSDEQKLESIGVTISDFFCGECRDCLKRCFGHFIRKQTLALTSYKEMLKSRQFSIFIQKCESMPECRRKTLPDCYLLISQRLTKYISLMERIYKYTDKDHKDYECLQDGIEEGKEIVQSINDELTEEQNRDFLNKITASYDNAIIKANGKVKKFDIKLRFNGRKLKTHGKTIWYINQGKHTVSLETTILLFNDSIFMLLEKDSRYYVPQIGDLNLPFIHLKHLLVKPNAVDKKSIFIINTEKSAAEMYRLMFETCEEANKWQSDIIKAAVDISKGK
ncbi:hypothetical protein LOD99_15405 [Oopsacas minuta]|uniref:DH domain-containing protein n=1 Tax=Oopsacas minuta TaxID=111878 RepID=A0AAV7KBI5_9METZ|nr:hypothetical protein LOD99_15405 [Oopsacas minuta]